MRDDGAGCLAVVFAVLLAIIVGFCHNANEANEAGRCAERWRYQATPADTLRTIRSGCSLPDQTPRGREP